MNSFIADELANKVYHLTKALKKANDLLDSLEEDNKNLLAALNSLAPENKKDYVLTKEVDSEYSYAEWC